MSATTWVQFDCVNLSCWWDHCERHAETGIDITASAGVDELVASLHTARCEDVALFTIRISEESNVSRAIRIVLDCLHVRWDVQLVATEVDETISALMTTTTTTRSDTTVAITALLLVVVSREQTLRLFLGDVRLVPD